MAQKDTTSKSWFCVLNNPREHGFDGTSKEILEKVASIWITDEYRACALALCLSENGLEHIHMVLSDDTAHRFSYIKKLYPMCHAEETKGSKKEAEDYIYKKGKFEDSTEKILEVYTHGEIKGRQGKRNDLDRINEYLNEGFTPSEIFKLNLSYRRYEKITRDAYFEMKRQSVPVFRDVYVEWHCGAAGTGKSHEYVNLCDEYGRDNIYFANDYDNGGSGLFDKYNAEKIVFIDEFKGQITFTKLLSLLDGYTSQVHCRYNNVYMLWDKVYISSIFPPELLYKKMVQEDTHIDTVEQLKRRIDKIVYHYKSNNQFKKYELSMKEYVSYDMLKVCALGDDDGFCDADAYDEPLPFT